jgi:demethylmenaquinone methyltransferase / 2-methoxy-6-polyprenyl-1,4-benzoquinol methylase
MSDPERIRTMFDRIAPGYDAMNTLFSLDRDRAWRRRAADLAGLSGGDTALDLCTGTGKLAGALSARVQPGGRVIGIDFSAAMLARARSREPDVTFALGDATALPFTDASVDAVTIAFGYRNLVDRAAGLREMLRVLRPGGRAVILEFAPPPTGVLGLVYRVYLERVMPVIAGAVARGQGSAYRYLSDTVQAFPRLEEVTAQMEAVGFRQVSARPMTFGIVVLYCGVRPA